MNKQVEINGSVYSIGQLNGLDQFHVSRRIGPILASMGVSLSSLRAGAKGLTAEDFAVSLGPVTEVMAAMSDETIEYIVSKCFSVVQRKQIGVGDQKVQWAPAARGSQMMFADINMPTMIRIVVAVLEVNLMDFLKELPGQETSASS